MIRTEGLRRTFSSRGVRVDAVRGIDLDVEAGQIFGFLGPNGAGKTTTLRMLATLLPPSGGRATVAGADLRTEPALVRRRIGYVSQKGSSYEEASGRMELVIQGRLHDMSRSQAEARCAELVERLELSDCIRRATKTYSGGQKRRLDVAIGLVHRPALLFLDEPTTGLDPQSRARMWEEVRGLRAAGTTVFLTTHYLEEADALCDRLAIIDHGSIVATGTPDELKRRVAGDVVVVGVDADRSAPALAVLRGHPAVREAELCEGGVRLFVDGGERAMPQLLRLLDGASVPLNSLSLHRPSLDDVFLRQTGRSLRDQAA